MSALKLFAVADSWYLCQITLYYKMIWFYHLSCELVTVKSFSSWLPEHKPFVIVEVGQATHFLHVYACYVLSPNNYGTRRW